MFRVLDPIKDIHEDILVLKGDAYKALFYKVRRIIEHQFVNKITRGIPGFLFYGEPGVGKTVMAKALARDLDYPLIFVDGSDIARSRYGESERLITDLFRGISAHSLVLIDDAESVFPRRDWVKGESWHVAQNNVLFHEIDLLDTSRVCVILTTNEIGLMDKALRDRLYEIAFNVPDKEVMLEIARERCHDLMIPWEPAMSRLSELDVRSIREVERIVLEHYFKG